jgi:hypothetical protein
MPTPSRPNSRPLTPDSGLARFVADELAGAGFRPAAQPRDRRALPTAAAVIHDSDALGALAYKVNRRCQEIGETPLRVLSSTDPDDGAFAPNAADPAAFLASRVDS